MVSKGRGKKRKPISPIRHYYFGEVVRDKSETAICEIFSDGTNIYLHPIARNFNKTSLDRAKRVPHERTIKMSRDKISIIFDLFMVYNID